jgi:hypothetical protein
VKRWILRAIPSYPYQYRSHHPRNGHGDVDSGQAAARALIAARSAPPTTTLYNEQLQQSILWQQLKRYQHLPSLLPATAGITHIVLPGIKADLSRVDAGVESPTLAHCISPCAPVWPASPWRRYFSEFAMSVNESLARNCYYPAQSPHIELREINEQQQQQLEDLPCRFVSAQG